MKTKKTSTCSGFAWCIVVMIGLLMSIGCGGEGNKSSSGQTAPAIAITATSLPAGNVGAPYGNSGTGGFLVTASGGVQPYTWSWAASAGSSVPPGLQILGSNGVITGTPTVAGTFSVVVTVSDSAGTKASVNFSIKIGAALPLGILPNSPLPEGTVTVAYGPLTPLQVSGGVPPYTYGVPAGSSLPSNLTMDSGTGTISGTPTVFGTFTFTVMVSDSEAPAMTATAKLSITINTLLFGQYSFLFNGFDANGAVAAAGSFTADGQGGITGGVEDVNRHLAGPATNVSITGTYSIGTDNRGTLTFSSSLGTSTFAVALNSRPFNSFPLPTSARFVEFDSNGTRGSGVIVANQGPCALSSILGDLALGISGDDVNKGRVAIAGRFHADGAGNLSLGLLDGNDAGALSSNITWTGTYASSANSSPRCTATFTPTGLPSLNFAVYPPFLVQVDSVSSGVPLTAGTVLQQIGAGTFTNASLSAPSVGGLTGFSVAAGAPDVSLVFFSPDGKGNVTITEDENKGGVVTTGTVLTGTYNVSPEGRVTLTTGNNPPVLYLAGVNSAFVVGTDSAATLGLLESQGGLALSNATLAGNFFSGTVTPASANVSDLSGVATLDGGSALTETSDESTPAMNIADQISSGTYSVTNTPVSGHGTLAITPTTGSHRSFFFLVNTLQSCGRRHCYISYTRVVAIPSDATETNPAVLVLEK